MNDAPLFLFGAFVFGLLGIGIGFTVSEFHAMTLAARDGSNLKTSPTLRERG